MKFGKLENIDGVDFSLPEDNLMFMPGNAENRRTQIFTGATSWNKDEWKGVLYPEKTRKTDYIMYYSRQFNSIELNATHYRTPSDKTLETWVRETPNDFRFCPKVLQAISHRHDMLTNKDLVNNFIVQLSKLGEKLGQVFIQLPPYFKYKNIGYLDRFLKAWPQEMPLAVELRDEEMNGSSDMMDGYYATLARYNCTPLITDVSGRRDLLHMTQTTSTAFIRWVGNGLHKTDYERLQEWKVRLAEWNEAGMEKVYFMMHEPENLKVPEIAEFFSQELKNNQYIDQRGPKLIREQPNLFS